MIFGRKRVKEEIIMKRKRERDERFVRYTFRSGGFPKCNAAHFFCLFVGAVISSFNFFLFFFYSSFLFPFFHFQFSAVMFHLCCNIISILSFFLSKICTLLLLISGVCLID